MLLSWRRSWSTLERKWGRYSYNDLSFVQSRNYPRTVLPVLLRAVAPKNRCAALGKTLIARVRQFRACRAIPEREQSDNSAGWTTVTGRCLPWPLFLQAHSRCPHAICRLVCAPFSLSPLLWKTPATSKNPNIWQRSYITSTLRPEIVTFTWERHFILYTHYEFHIDSLQLTC